MNDVLKGIVKNRQNQLDREEERHRELIAATLAAGLLANPNITEKHPQIEAAFRDCMLQVEKILG